MADLDIQISGLPALSSIQDTDLLHVKRGTTDYKMTYANLIKEHEDRIDNPHNVTKTQVGLSNVTNDAQLKIASNLSDLASASLARTNLDVYSKSEIATQIAVHSSRTDNPHAVTKTQVGLSNVTNNLQLTTSNNLSDLVSKATARTNLDVYSKTESDNNLTAHTGRTDNPHSVTKSQIGLGNVLDYGISLVYTDNQTNKYASAKSVKDAYDNAISTASTNLTNHTSNTSNPHSVTKAQVGLGSVANYAPTNSYLGNSVSLYATQKAINDLYNTLSNSIGIDITSHLDDLNNPHQVTKAQVGLGSVSNYASTSSYTNNNASLYATAKAVNDGVANAKTVASDALTAHTNLSNPHNTTKSNVGLGNVQNFGISNSYTLNNASQYSSSKALFDGLADIRATHLPKVSWSQYGGNLNSSDGGSIITGTTLEGKEVIVVAIDTDDIDEVVAPHFFIPMEPTGLQSNARFYYAAKENEQIEYTYSTGAIKVTGFSIKRIYYREPQDLPNIGTISGVGNG